MDGVSLIAGNGVLPALFAAGGRRRGLRVCMIALEGETDPAAGRLADEAVWVKVGQIGAMVKALKRFGNRRVAFVGGVRKTKLFSVRPDIAALKLLAKARDMRDDTLLKTLAAHLEREGFEVVPCTECVPELVTTPGVMGRKKAAAAQAVDARKGFEVLDALAAFSTGQSVVMRGGVVLAIEAVEGTDGAITRAGALGAKGAVLVKAAKTGQDPRFDVPAIGPATMHACRTAGVTAIFLEARTTMLLGLRETLDEADRLGVAVVGVAR